MFSIVANTFLTGTIDPSNTGTIVFTVESKLAYITGNSTIITKQSNPSDRFEATVASYNKVINNSSNDLISDQATFWLGVAYYDNNQLTKAFNTFKSHHNKYPESAFSKSDLRFESEIFLKQGDVASARVLLNELQTEQARVTLLLISENRYFLGV